MTYPEKTPTWIDRLFLTKAYLATLTDEQLQVRCLSSERLGYQSERTDRAFARSMAAMRELTADMDRRNVRSQIEREIREERQAQVDALFERVLELNKELGEQDRQLEDEHSRAVFWRGAYEGCYMSNTALLQQVDDLREERNQLLDLVHGYEQQLSAQTPV